MRNLYNASGYFLEKMELKFMWLDSQVERIKEKEKEKEIKQNEKEDTLDCKILA